MATFSLEAAGGIQYWHHDYQFFPHKCLIMEHVDKTLQALCGFVNSRQQQRLLHSPFCQVAGEVLSEADDAPVLCVIDPIESFLVGQVHLLIYEEQTQYLYNTLYLNLLVWLCYGNTFRSLQCSLEDIWVTEEGNTSHWRSNRVTSFHRFLESGSLLFVLLWAEVKLVCLQSI